MGSQKIPKLQAVYVDHLSVNHINGILNSNTIFKKSETHIIVRVAAQAATFTLDTLPAILFDRDDHIWSEL